jgi:hypothetical protein
MENEICVSAYMTSIRPYRWMRMHEMLSKSGLNFEIVIVGPVQPNFALPSEIKFYYSNLKPLQCCHAAVTLCSGQTLLQLVDDIDYQDGGISKMYEAAMSADNVMATCIYSQNGNKLQDKQNIAGQTSSTLPLLPVCGIYQRNIYSKIGGIDRRFNGVMGELDLYMRMSINGYRTIFVDYVCNENTAHQAGEKTSLCMKFWDIDRPRIIKLWTTNNNLFLIRNDILRSYENKDLLTVEQNY